MEKVAENKRFIGGAPGKQKENLVNQREPHPIEQWDQVAFNLMGNVLA